MRTRTAVPRRRLQLLVWVLVAGVFSGFAVLADQAGGSGGGGPAAGSVVSMASERPTAAPAATTPVTTAPSVTTPGSAAAGAGGSAGGRVLAADVSGWGRPLNTVCSTQKENTDFLPMHRWTSFDLAVVDNARIIKTRLFMTMIASLMFMAAALIWRLIGMVMGFSYSYDMVCSAADPINTAAGMIAEYAAWFMIPAWLIVLVAAAKRATDKYSTGVNKGPWGAIRLIVVFLVATGAIFFLADQSNKHQQDPLSPYTGPWMAAKVQSYFGEASASLLRLGDLSKVQSSDRGSAFYDTDPATAGNVTCAKLDAALYTRYISDNGHTDLGTGGSAVMAQLSKIWEVSLVRSWTAAQFGEGTTAYPSPAHAACRMLEAHADVSNDKKYEAYDLSTGNAVGTTNKNTWRGFFIAPPDGEQTVMVAWGACKGDDNGRGSSHTIPQWDAATGMPNKAKSCGRLYSGDNPNGVKGFLKQLFTGAGDLDAFYFNGGDELSDKLGDCVTTKVECRYDWDFVDGWLGANKAERLTQGMMSLIVAIVFLLALGPMAIGLMVISDALAILVVLLAITLLLLALGKDSGKRLIKLTGAAAAGKFIFGVALTFLMMFIQISYAAINAALGDDPPSFTEQMLQGATPLVALFIFKKLSKAVGLGNISSLSGALGFAGAAALKATGDRETSAAAERGWSGATGFLTAGTRRLNGLTEQSLENRMLGSQSLVGRGVRRLARPITAKVGDTYESGRAGLLRASHALQRAAVSGSPAKRAAAYGAVTAGLAAGTLVAPAAGIATVPLMAGTGLAAMGSGAQAGWRRIRPRPGIGDGPTGLGGYDPDSAAGIALTKNDRTAARHADIWHRRISKVPLADRKELEGARTNQTLDLQRARQWGAGYENGLNAEFAGFANTDEMMRARGDLAEAMGVPEDQLLVGSHGLAIPTPAFVDHRGQRVFPPGISIEQASHPIHYLDRYTLRRQKIDGVEENDDQYIVRITTQLRERGYVTDNGEFVDVFAAHGYDSRDPKTRERIAAFISGSKDEELSKIVVTARRSEDVAVAAAREWAEAQGPKLQVFQERNAQSVNVLMETAQREIGDFGTIKVERLDGSETTAGQIHVELDRKFQDMESVVQQVRDLYEHGGSITPDLQIELRSGAQDIDGLSTALRDAIDVSSAARSVTQLRVEMVDPTVSLDSTQVTAAAKKLNEEVQRQQDALHKLIDKQIGGLSRVPADQAQADEVYKALNDLRKLVSDQIDAERKNNEDVLRELSEAQTLFENRQAIADPRRVRTRMRSVHDILADQHRAESDRVSTP
ncbi:hypothetical protein ACRYCC_13100 [Actinomadura scrupuli]|uniref:hypothetical protein n=1 Tax=Actinomadura scrupuli TaxID=559629 RepID=UPI003D984E6F